MKLLMVQLLTLENGVTMLVCKLIVSKSKDTTIDFITEAHSSHSAFIKGEN